jgi:hypothetical protein
VRPQGVHDLGGDGADDVQWRPHAAGAPGGDALEDVVPRLLADAGHAENRSAAARLLEALDRVDAEPLVEQPRRLRPEPANLE